MATDCASDGAPHQSLGWRPSSAPRMAPLISPSDGAPHQVFPLLAGALELSPEEVTRARAGHLAHLAGGSSGLISTETLWGLISSSAAAPATAPASAAAGAMGAGAALPPPKLLGAEPPPSATGAVAGTVTGGAAGGAAGAVAGAVADAAAAEAAATKEKMNRMKKLLAAADKRIEQASAIECH